MAEIMVVATVSAPQFGLPTAGDIGLVDEELAAGYLAKGYLVRTTGEFPPTSGRKARQSEPPAEEPSAEV